MQMPVLFIAHGSPMNAIEENSFTLSLQKLSKKIPQPTAILVISAHWETNGTYVTSMVSPKTIHDFVGFPKELYQIEYKAQGSPKLARTIIKEMATYSIKSDHSWGLDHGTWSILRHLYPNADIPTIQLSIDTNKSFREHFQLAQALRFLRNENVLIIGSGNITHNLSKISWDKNSSTYEWAQKFDQWVLNKTIVRNFEALIENSLDSTIGKISIPTPEHYIPFLYILGLSCKTDKLIIDYEGFQNASISMRCFRFSKD